MSDVTNIPTGLGIPTQIPLDTIAFNQSESLLSNLGTDNFLALKYYEGLVVYCINEKSTYIWREVETGEENTGLISLDFTYPNNHIVYGINYSNRKFNFFKKTNEFNLENIGVGSEIYKNSNINNLKQFRKINSINNLLSIIQNSNDISLSINELLLSNFVKLNQKTLISTDDSVNIEVNDSTIDLSVSTSNVEINNLQKSINLFPYNLSNDDDKYTIFIDNGLNDVIINLPNGLVNNFSVAFIQKGTGNVTFNPVTTTLNSPLGLKLKGQNHWALIEKELNLNNYYLIGSTKI